MEYRKLCSIFFAFREVPAWRGIEGARIFVAL